MSWITLMGALSPVIGKLIDKIFPGDDELTKQKKAQLELEITKALVEAEGKQIEVNKVEAGHPSLFVAGWRPFVGWAAAIGFVFQFLLAPMINYVLITHNLPELPVLEIDQLYTMLMGMLGLGGLRTFEKIRGVARENHK